jgi:hypothetical protein
MLQHLYLKETNRPNIAAATQTFVCQFQSQKEDLTSAVLPPIAIKMLSEYYNSKLCQIETSNTFPAFKSAQKKVQNLRMQGET